MTNTRRAAYLALVLLFSLACSLTTPTPTVVFTPAAITPAENTPEAATPAPTLHPTSAAPSEVNAYLQSLPAWEAVSPPQPDQPPTPAGEPSIEEPVSLSTPLKSDDGSIERGPDGEPVGYENVTYVCTVTPYTLTDTPEKIVMYNPDASVLWPGSLIQGQSHAGGRGSLLAIPVAERAPIIVTIADFFNDNPSSVVENPNLDTVTRAVNGMVAQANAEGLATPSTIAFEMKSYHTEADFALSFGLSGRYLGFEGSASGDMSQSAAETSVAVHFYQQMFTVVVPPPQVPGAFFSPAFTQAKLDEQIALGRLGPDNLPVYVSEVVYGRMLMFTLTSSASESEIRGTLNAAYNGIGGSVEGSLSAAQRNLLQQSKLAITSYGGPADATAAIIRSGDWSQYFTDSAPLTTARPLSYVFRNLDGSIAQVTEAANYNVRECQAQTGNPGTFEFLPAQAYSQLPIVAPYETHLADLNGDGRADLILNHRRASTNQVVVGLADGQGGFAFTEAFVHPEAPTDGWGNAKLYVADVDGDGRADLLWNQLGQENRVYVGLSHGDGAFTVLPAQVHPSGGWGPYQLLAGDLNGDGRDDLIWNEATTAGNRVYTALSNGDGTFAFTLPPQDHLGGGLAGSGWDGFQPLAADVNGDGRTDLVWTLAGQSFSYVGRSLGDGRFDLSGARQAPPENICCGYALLAGDVNGDGRADLVWSGVPTSHNRTYFGLGQANGGFDLLQPFQDHPAPEQWHFFQPWLADFSGDGRADLLWIDTHATTAHLFTGIATAGGHFQFDFSRVPQDHPAVDEWATATTHVGDINGDRLADVVWVFAGAPLRVYVALATP